MADWLLVVPGGPAAATALPHLADVARVLRAPDSGMIRRTEVDGAFFLTVAEGASDPGVVFTARGSEARCAVVASSLLVEREALVAALRPTARDASLSAEDGVLLAHAVGRWGNEAWEKLGGEFAAAAWLPTERTVLLAADGEGARPVFWATAGSGLIASTRFEAVSLCPAVSREPDVTGILNYLCAVRELPESGRTWLTEVQELPPGHCLRWHNGTATRRRWWSFPADVQTWFPRDRREAAERFRDTLRSSVRERLRGHRRVAIALSGGMDSTAVASQAAALRDEDGMDIEITGVHAEYPPELESQEARLAAEAARALRLPLVSARLALVPPWPMNDGAGSWPPHHWFGHAEPLRAALAANGTVVLTGTSGEIFSMATLLDAVERGRPQDILAAWASYRRLGMAFRPWRRRYWRRLAHPFSGAVGPPPPWIAEDAQARFGTEECRMALTLWESPATPARLALMHAFLAATRRTSHWSDSGRTRLPSLDPFADRRVVRLAASVQSVPWRLDKTIAREAVAETLPLSIVTRPRVPTPNFLRIFFDSGVAREVAGEPLHPLLRELVNEERWRESTESVPTFVQGYTWLAVLAANAWLRDLDQRS